MSGNRVIFDEDICKGCELCISACPKGIIKLNKKKMNKKGYSPVYVEEMNKCIACANCAITCPDSVIRVEKH